MHCGFFPCLREIWHEESSVKSIDKKATKSKRESYSFGIFTQTIYLDKIVYFLISKLIVDCLMQSKLSLRPVS